MIKMINVLNNNIRSGKVFSSDFVELVDFLLNLRDIFTEFVVVALNPLNQLLKLLSTVELDLVT